MARNNIQVIKKTTKESTPKPKEPVAVEKPQSQKKVESEEELLELLDLVKIDHLEWELVKYYIQDNKVIDKEILRRDCRNILLDLIKEFFRNK